MVMLSKCNETGSVIVQEPSSSHFFSPREREGRQPYFRLGSGAA